MTNEYDAGFEQAEKDASDELAGKLKDMKFDEAALLKLAPEGPPREKLKALVIAVKEAETAQKTKEAFTRLAIGVGENVLKAALKAIT